MTRVEREIKRNALALKRRKAAISMMKIYRRRQRNLKYILGLIKIMSIIALPLLFIMFMITVDPVYVGTLKSTYFLVAIVITTIISILAQGFGLKLKKITKR